MPVVGKIEQVTLPDHPEGFGMRIQGLDVIVMDNEDLEWISENAPQMSNKMECAYIHVIEFIKWYNENK